MLFTREKIVENNRPETIDRKFQAENSSKNNSPKINFSTLYTGKDLICHQSKVFKSFYRLLELFTLHFFSKRIEMLPRFSKMQESFYTIFHAGSLKFLNFTKNDPSCMPAHEEISCNLNPGSSLCVQDSWKKVFSGKNVN